MNSLKADCNTPNKRSQSNVYNWNACMGTFFFIKEREMLKMGAILRPKICQRGQENKNLIFMFVCHNTLIVDRHRVFGMHGHQTA